VTEKNETEMISRRRVFSLVGLAALSVAMSPAVLTVSEAEAQQPSTTTPQTPQTGTTTTAPQTGRQRRRQRRQARRQRRHERREARRNRRHERREERAERRQRRRGSAPSTSATPEQAPAGAH
jgi:hypothetical protein